MRKYWVEVHDEDGNYWDTFTVNAPCRWWAQELAIRKVRVQAQLLGEPLHIARVYR